MLTRGTESTRVGLIKIDVCFRVYGHGQRHKSFIGLQRMIQSHRHLSERMDPCESALDHVPSPVTPRPFESLKASTFPMTAFARNARNGPVSTQILPKRPTRIGAIPQNLPKPFSGASLSHRNYHPVHNLPRPFDLVGRPSFQYTRRRNPVAVDNNRPLRFQAATCTTDTATPLFAGAKLPSRIPGYNFHLPLYPKFQSKTGNHTPRFCQATSRRWQPASDPRSHGTSRHRHPDFNTNRMPFIVFRSSARIRPIFRIGSSGIIRFKSRSDSSASRFKEQPPSLGGNGRMLYLIRFWCRFF